jgi:hypothetical protein
MMQKTERQVGRKAEIQRNRKTERLKLIFEYIYFWNKYGTDAI